MTNGSDSYMTDPAVLFFAVAVVIASAAVAAIVVIFCYSRRLCCFSGIPVARGGDDDVSVVGMRSIGTLTDAARGMSRQEAADAAALGEQPRFFVVPEVRTDGAEAGSGHTSHFASIYLWREEVAAALAGVTDGGGGGGGGRLEDSTPVVVWLPPGTDDDDDDASVTTEDMAGLGPPLSLYVNQSTTPHPGRRPLDVGPQYNSRRTPFADSGGGGGGGGGRSFAPPDPPAYRGPRARRPSQSPLEGDPLLGDSTSSADPQVRLPRRRRRGGDDDDAYTISPPPADLPGGPLAGGVSPLAAAGGAALRNFTTRRDSVVTVAVSHGGLNLPSVASGVSASPLLHERPYTHPPPSTPPQRAYTEAKPKDSDL